jgi:hypothetical protein
MSRFQERLWDELVRDHAAALAYPAAARSPLRSLPIVEEEHRPAALRRRPARPGWQSPPELPAPRRRPAPRLGALLLAPGRLAATLAALAATVAVVTILSTTGTTPSSAYAVTQNPDGTITVTIEELTGVTGANSQLARLAVNVRVVPVKAGCPAPTGIVPTPPSLAARIAHTQGQGLAIRPDLVPAGETLLLTAREAGPVVDLSYSLYRGALPSCIGIGDDHAG